MSATATARKAQATVISQAHLRGDVGPCLCCSERAVVKVIWAIANYGEVIGFYCPEHTPL